MSVVERPIQPLPAQGRLLSIESPATGQPIGEIRVSSAEEVRAAIGRARRAQPAWQSLGIRARADYLRKALARLLEAQDQYIEVIRRETGRSRVETILMEIFPACDSLGYFAKNAEKLLKDERVPLHLLKNKKLIVTYQPLGVIGIITPWNGPFILSLNPTIQALVAGNTVVLKPSEVTPISGRLVRDLFTSVGLPEDVLVVLDGDGETGAALVEGGVDKIAFTGSVRTGRKIGESCGRQLIPCTLELGGKDPMIVCADADTDRAARGCVFGAMLNAGQFCCSTERVYVVESVADEFIGKVVEHVRALKQGRDGEYDVGPIISQDQMRTIERHIDDAKAKGAHILTGGKTNASLGPTYYEATVLTDVTPDMLVMREESFGPILPIVRVKDEEEALRMANDSSYGLSSTLWTKDDARAMALARRIQSGSVCVNDSSITYGVLEAPFGGMKESGLGHIHGSAGLRGYCFSKPIILDRFQRKDEAAWYPFTQDKGDFLQKVMRWIWGTRIGRFLA